MSIQSAPTLPVPLPSSSSRLYIIKTTFPYNKTITVFNRQGQSVYNASLRSNTRPHVVITATTPTAPESPSHEVGSIFVHPTSRSIFFTVNNSSLELQPKSMFGRNRFFESPSTGHTMEWREGHWGTVLVDEDGVAAAKLTASQHQPWKRREVEVYETWADEHGEQAVEEVLFSAIGIIEFRRRRARIFRGGYSTGLGGGGLSM